MSLMQTLGESDHRVSVLPLRDGRIMLSISAKDGGAPPLMEGGICAVELSVDGSEQLGRQHREAAKLVREQT